MEKLKTLEQYKQEYAKAINESIEKGNGNDYIVKFEVWTFCKFTADYNVDMVTPVGKKKLFNLMAKADEDLTQVLTEGMAEVTEILRGGKI